MYLYPLIPSDHMSASIWYIWYVLIHHHTPPLLSWTLEYPFTPNITVRYPIIPLLKLLISLMPSKYPPSLFCALFYSLIHIMYSLLCHHTPPILPFHLISATPDTFLNTSCTLWYPYTPSYSFYSTLLIPSNTLLRSLIPLILPDTLLALLYCLIPHHTFLILSEHP